MRSLHSYIVEFLSEVNEQAMHLSEIRKRASNKSPIIIAHLAKIYLNFDKNDNRKHAAEISPEIISVIYASSKSKKLKASILLFNDATTTNINDSINIENLNNFAINSLDDRYDAGKVLELNGSDFGKLCVDFIKWLDEDKIHHKFEIANRILTTFEK